MSLLDELDAADCWCGRTEEDCADNGGCRWSRARAAEREAARKLSEAQARAHVAEQDAVHADLSQLLRVLGMGDHARPQSSHEVMLDAINEVGRIRLALECAEVLIAERDRRVADLWVMNEQLRKRITTLAAMADD